MLKTLWARLLQKHRTIDFPNSKPVLPERFRGLPVIGSQHCETKCQKCNDVCPTGAIQNGSIDLGRCLFCTECEAACEVGKIKFSQDYRLGASRLSDLMVSGDQKEQEHRRKIRLSAIYKDKINSLFGRSLKLRQVSAGGCNGCEVETAVLNTIIFDLGRFGIQFVASPRHADGILVTGPVTNNMKFALRKTYEAVPAPKIVIAVGACAISGGIFARHKEVCDGALSASLGEVPIDLYIPGCPPHPITILDGILKLIKNFKIYKAL